MLFDAGAVGFGFKAFIMLPKGFKKGYKYGLPSAGCPVQGRGELS